MIFGNDCDWCDTPLSHIEGRHLAHGEKVYQLCPACGQRNEFGPLRTAPKGPLTLDAARSHPRAHVVVRLDSGGMIPYTAPAADVRCSEEALIAATIQINRFTMGGDSNWTITYEEHDVPAALGGGLDGGRVESTLWLHKQLQSFGLPHAFGELLAGKREPLAMFAEGIAALPRQLRANSNDAGALQEGLSLFFFAIGFPTYARASDHTDPENGFPVSIRAARDGPEIDGLCGVDSAYLRECLDTLVEFHGAKAPPGWPDEHHAVFTTLPAASIEGDLVATATENRISIVCAEALAEFPAMVGDNWARHNLLAALKGGLVYTFKPAPKEA